MNAEPDAAEVVGRINKNFRVVQAETADLFRRDNERERDGLWLRAMVGMTLSSILFDPPAAPRLIGGALWLAVAVLSLVSLWISRNSGSGDAPQPEPPRG